MSATEESTDDGMEPVRAPGSHFVSTMFRVFGWFALAIGTLVLAVRIYRAFTEGVPTLTCCAVLFLAPLSYLGFSFLSTLGAKCFARGRWYRGLAAVAGSMILPVLALKTTDYLYETSNRAADTELDSHDWVEFRVPTTAFAVELPTPPTKESQIIDSAAGDIRIEMYSAEQGALVFCVVVSEYPPGTVDSLKLEEKDFVTHMSDAAIEARSGSKLISRRSIALDEWVGLEDRVEMPAGRTGDLKPEHPVAAVQRYYQCDDRMVQFRVLTLKSLYEGHSSEFQTIADRFLNSIRIDSEASIESARRVDH